jgi:hypothetical protein
LKVSGKEFSERLHFVLRERERDVELRVVQKLRNDELLKLYTTTNILVVPATVGRTRV